MGERRWMRVLVAIGAIAAIAGASPALAKKPTPPQQETVTVTMAYQGSGLATIDECGGSITMTLNGESLIMVWENTALEMSFGSMGGCHGPLVAGLEDSYSGNFGLIQQRDGTVRLGSRFDYYYEYETVRKREIQKVVDFCEVTGTLTPSSGFDWSPGGGGTLAGSLDLRSFHKVDKDGEWTEIGSFDVTITVTISS
jgi:hypothetical protein